MTPAPTCWLAKFRPDVPCDGKLVKAHLIPRQLMRREVRDDRLADALWDRRGWVWACGGPTGIGGHHGMLDTSRTLRVPRLELPVVLEEFAEELGLSWWLDREYGHR